MGHGNRARAARRFALTALLLACVQLPAMAKDAGAVPAPTPAEPADPTADLPPLERLWHAPEGIGIMPYGQSYLLVTHTDHPNAAPYSPNPVDNVGPITPPEPTEVKFALSLKVPVVPSRVLGHENSIWAAYTQQSHWQAFDAGHSRPFRESNYEPELIFSHRLAEEGAPPPGFRPVFLNLGLLHQSNGQSDPRSRSWNRAYVQWGVEQRWTDGDSVALLLRPWWRLPEPAQSDNNPDIVHYLGHGDIEAQYWHADKVLSLLARERALQADFSTPLLFLSRGRPKRQALQLHLQIFTGYGESLIDYNQRHTTLGVGVSMPYGL